MKSWDEQKMFNQIGSELSLSLLCIQYHGSYQSQCYLKSKPRIQILDIESTVSCVLSARDYKRRRDKHIVYNRKAIKRLLWWRCWRHNTTQHYPTVANSKWLYHMIYCFCHCFYRYWYQRYECTQWTHLCPTRSHQCHWILSHILISALISEHDFTAWTHSNYNISIQSIISWEWLRMPSILTVLTFRV